MIDKIFKIFFEKKRKTKCLTIIKKREITVDDKSRFNQKVIDQEKTCLSSYFENRKGLNMANRLKANV